MARLSRPNKTAPGQVRLTPLGRVFTLLGVAVVLVLGLAWFSASAQQEKPQSPEPPKADSAAPAPQAPAGEPAKPEAAAAPEAAKAEGSAKAPSGPATVEAAAALARSGDHKAAYAAYLALAKQGDPQAQFKVGQMLDEGLGTQKDCVKALEWLTKAADQGLAAAQSNLADHFRYGRCAAKNFKEAMRWYLRAAYQNHAPAMRNLAVMFDSYSLGGRSGKLIAYFWAVLAAKLDPEAADLRDRIMASLAPFQIEQVQAKAGEWSPGKEFDALEDLQQKKTGTGFVVGRKGFVVTNAHVVRGFKFLRGEIGGKEYQLSVVKADDVADLALLKMDAEAPDAFRLRTGSAIKPGEPVVAIGFPLRGLLASDPAVTTGTVSALAGLKNDKRFVQFTAPIQPGNSGGPLLDGSGNVVGVVALKLNALAVADITGDLPQNVNFAINVDLLRQFLESGGVHPDTSASVTPLKPTEIFERSLNKVMSITASNQELVPKTGAKPQDVVPEGG